MNYRFNRAITPDAGVQDATITFYDNFIPALQAGEYTITVSQLLSGDTVIPENPQAQLSQSQSLSGGAGIPEIPQAALSQKFVVKGPRFVLDPADIHRAFPANNSTGLFSQFFPMIVFNKRSLPWERHLKIDGVQKLQINDAAQPSQYPWMALLVFSPEDLVIPGSNTNNTAGNNQSNPSCSASMAVSNIAGGAVDGVWQPAMKEEDGENFSTTYCNVIDIKKASFLAIAPTLDDARFLSHVRNVSTDNKEPLSMVHDGWFANVLSNRCAVALPSGTTSTNPSQKNIVHLVSLEGFEECLNNPDYLDGTIDYVRMISLYSWTFNCLQTRDENFEQFMIHLVDPVSVQGTNLQLQIPVPSGTTYKNPAVDTLVANQLLKGYVPLSYATWSGEQTFAWYRGPLSPVAVGSFLETTDNNGNDTSPVPMVAADVMVYDKQTGLFDQSYAVAFQTGRSLALANSVFSTNLLQWRRTAHGLVDLLMEYIRSPALQSKFIADGIIDNTGNLTATGIADLAILLNKNIIADGFKNYLATSFYDDIATKIGNAGGFTPGDNSTVIQAPNTPNITLPADLLSLMQNPDIVSLLSHLSGLDTIGSTADAFSQNSSAISLVGQGATEALIVGSVINMISPDGTTSVILSVSQAVAKGGMQIPVQPYTGLATLPAGSLVQFGSGQILAQQIVQWLAQTALLYDVPFNNLVADPQMLPQECIRFFYIDENWIDALLDGALSIGIQSGRDSLFHQLMRDKLHTAVDAILGDVRDALRNKVGGGTQLADGTKTGFLLRSGVISAWPGMEIRAWADAAKTTLLKPLRLDRVAPDILFAIFPDIPVEVDIEEPSEGLVFGFEDDGIDLRYIPGVPGNGPTGSTNNNKVQPVAIQGTLKGSPNSASKYNISGSGGLVSLLADQLGIATLTPASFAVQMVKVPEQMQFISSSN